MTDPATIEDRLCQRFAGIAARANDDPGLCRRAAFLTVDALVAIGARPFYLSVVAGRIAALEEGPRLMRPWAFGIRGTARAWQAYWEAMPQPGWHDLLALSKRGELQIEGNLHPFIANLQYFKDLLALPRHMLSGDTLPRDTLPARSAG